MIDIIIGGYTVFLSKETLELAERYKQDTNRKHESGGILLGQVFEKNIYILKFSEPCENDKSTRYSFERDKNNAQKIVEKEFLESNGKTIYIGEWHTHPEERPTPSNQDLRMIKEQFKKNKINEKFLLLFILGLKYFFIGIYDGNKIMSQQLPLNKESSNKTV